MIRKILCLLLLLSGYSGLGAQGLLYELEQLSNPDMLPQYRQGVVREFSSYDTTGGNDDGFSGKYSFIRMEGGKQVLAEMTGPGVINRIHTPTPTEDTIEFYFDGESSPRIRMPFSGLFTGNEFPFLNPVCDHEVGGYYCYLPIPYQKSCKVLYTGKMLFWQLQYRTYPEGTHMKTFSPEWDQTEVAALNKAVGVWEKYGTNILDESYKDFKIKTTEVRLNPGESKRIFESGKGGRIIGIEIEGLDKLQRNDNRAILKAKWDNDALWSVKAPLKDLFGYYFGEKSMRSLLAGSSDENSYLYYPMPFSRNAIVEIELPDDDQTTKSGVNLLVRVYYQERPRAENEGRFYAHWRRDIDPPTGEPYIIAPEITGRGHYVGTILLCQGHETGSTWYFEGDDRTYIDGELVIPGTGSEDFFNGGYYEIADRWDMAHSLPSHGCLGYSSPLGRTGAFRHYFADKLSFSNNFSLTIEHGPVGNKIPVDYRSVAFYYADKGIVTEDITHNMKEYPELKSIKCHSTQMNVLSFRNGAILSERKPNTDRDRVLILEPSNDQVIMVAKFGLQVPSGLYDLYYSYFRTPSSGEIRISQRQNILMEWKNIRTEKEEYIAKEPVGRVDVHDEMLTITFYVRGKEPGILLLSGILLEKVEDD